MNKAPLVSVWVLTYNSSETVIETLDSIKQQTYENLELIISDDFSHDNTVEICEQWVKKNEGRFVRTQIVTSDRNSGVPSNCNRAVKACMGEYQKCIAGDDILLPDCIKDNLDYMNQHPEALIVFSRCQRFTVENGKKREGKIYPLAADEKIMQSSIKHVLLRMYCGPFIPACTLFARTKLFDQFQFLEEYRAFEDTPFYITLLRNGIKLHYFEKVTVLYRIAESTCHSTTKFRSAAVLEANRMFLYRELYEELTTKYPDIYKYKLATFHSHEFQIVFLRNKKNLFTRFVNHLFLMFMKKDLKVNIEQYL